MWQKEKKVASLWISENIGKRMSWHVYHFTPQNLFFGYNFSTCCYPTIPSYDVRFARYVSVISSFVYTDLTFGTLFRWKRSTYNDFSEERLSVLKFFANYYSHKSLLQHSELFNGGKKSHMYLNKPAAKSFRFDNPIELLALETPLVNNQC